jgi:hypothetical protein
VPFALLALVISKARGLRNTRPEEEDDDDDLVPIERATLERVNGHLVNNCRDIDHALHSLQPEDVVRVHFKDGRVRWARITRARALEILPCTTRTTRVE